MPKAVVHVTDEQKTRLDALQKKLNLETQQQLIDALLGGDSSIPSQSVYSESHARHDSEERKEDEKTSKAEESGEIISQKGSKVTPHFSPSDSMVSSTQTNEAWTCLWEYKEYVGSKFETAQCMPKSADNKMSLKDLQGFCKICPVALKNLRLLARGGKAQDLAINVKQRYEALEVRKTESDLERTRRLETEEVEKIIRQGNRVFL